MVGKTIKVIVDRKENGFYIGRSESDSPEVDNEVLIESPESDIKIGRFYSVKITRSDFFDLYGTISKIEA